MEDERPNNYLRERFELLFYCWTRTAILVPLTAQAVEMVVALTEGRPANIVVSIR
ncbi:MAG TPA: hypothetical protein VEX36_06925 [Thermoleophilaceae bacterium]|nr:hypothetical protein [Thermoleophilaceae bacterium]